MSDSGERQRLLESEIDRRLEERFAALREEFERLRRESDARWGGFASRFDQKISGIVPVELLGDEAPRRAARESALTIDSVRSLDAAATQAEILEELLALCLRHASRAAILVLRGDVFTVWRTAGGSEKAARGISFSAGDGVFARVAEGAPCRLSSGNDVSSRLSFGDAAAAVLVPIVIGEKVSGALYADAAAADADRLDPGSVAMLAFLCGISIERAGSRKSRPSPALREFEDFSLDRLTVEDYDTQVASLWKESPTPAQAAGSSSAAPQSPPEAGPARNLSGPLAPRDEEEQRAEARRFARLLVSEIKLYNERAVAEGRAEGNLYRRLKPEIDLSRQVYEERIPESIRSETDFLQEELVRILADGRPEDLGF